MYVWWTSGAIIMYVWWTGGAIIMYVWWCNNYVSHVWQTTPACAMMQELQTVYT